MRVLKPRSPQQGLQGDAGFVLVGAIVLVFLVLLTLSVAAPRIARQMQRDKEIESQHRANQYVRAIRMYYKKFGHYPGSIEQLEKTNNQRFLRARYVDPLTGKDDWRVIHVGENKTKVKGFFGQDLPGLQAGLGAAASLASNIGNGRGSDSSTNASGNAGGGSAFNNNLGGGGGGSAFNNNNNGAGAGLTGGVGAGNSPGATGTNSNGVTSQNATDATGSGGGPIMGIGSARSGESMVVINEQSSYETWEFLYDPRIEQLYAKGNLLGGGVASGGVSSLGSASTLASPTNTTPGSTTPNPAPTQPTTPP